MTHFELMESQGQTNIFQFLPSTVIEEEIKIGDAAKITLTNTDEDTINYFKYYYPHVINKPGVIVDKEISGDKAVYWINVRGEVHPVYGHELILLY